MGAHSARRGAGEPSPDLARSLGRLLIASEQLRKTAYLLSQTEANGAGDLATWNQFASHLFELNRDIVDQTAIVSFTGAAGESLTIRGHDGAPFAVDAGYIHVLSRRMDRHARIGRLLLTPVPMLESSTA